MKKLFLIFAVATTMLAACKSDEPSKFQIDPTVTVNIKGENQSQKTIGLYKSAVDHLSNVEIVKQTFLMRFTLSDGRLANRGFADEQRDTTYTNPMLKMWGTDILYYDELIDGTQTGDVLLGLDFLEAKNCVFETIKGDTIAYIPNSVLRDAETRIKALYNAKDYQPIYTIFNDAYTFIPITGSEYRELESEK